MSEAHLPTLGLSLKRVESRVGFLESYARSCLRQRPEPEDGQDDWNLTVEAASHLCEAGQWAMLVDARKALALWREAADLYYALRFGFGYYLSMVVGVNPVGQYSANVATDLRAAVRMLGRGRITDEPPDDDKRLVAPVPFDPMRHPQQQAYLVLAAARELAVYGDPSLRQDLLPLLDNSPHRVGVAPVGSLGMPIRTLWNAARLFATGDGATELPPLLSAMSVRYEQSMQLAMANQYLWNHGAAPVDVGNVDIATLTIAAYRTYREDFTERMEPMIETLPSLAKVQMQIGMELTDATDWA
jgi:hypothetical protein